MALKDHAAEVLSKLLAAMHMPAEVAASEDEESITLEIRGSEAALIIGKQGQTLDALQYLVNKMTAFGRSDTEDKPIHVDAEGYRARRAESLTELANRLAEKAVRTGQPVAASPMSPADRRIMHVALSERPDLTTCSEGEGVHRHLVIIPRRSADDHSEPGP